MAALHDLFAQFDVARKGEEWEKALKAPDDEDALKCKAICLVKLERWDEPHRYQIVTFTQGLSSPVVLYERLYALYRLEKFPLCLAGLGKAPKTSKFLSLRAQVLYQMERYEDAVKVYQQAFDETPESDAALRAHLLTNLAAAQMRVGAFGAVKNISEVHGSVVKRTYDLAYNVACVHIEEKRFNEALTFLDMALRACQVQFADRTEDLQNESAALEVQRAFVLQKLGKGDEALSIYSKIEESKPSDVSAWAVATNNALSLTSGDRLSNLRKFNKLHSDGVQKLLTRTQKEAIGFNHGLLLLQMAKYGECRDVVAKLTTQYPQNDLLPLLTASILLKENKQHKTQAVLQDFLAANPQSSERVRLAMAQMQRDSGNYEGALSLLEGVQTYWSSPAFVATVLALAQAAKKPQKTIEVIKKAVDSLGSSGASASLVSECAAYLASLGEHSLAASLYAKIQKKAKDAVRDRLTLALIYELAFSEPDRALALEAALPSVKLPAPSVDVDSLEPAYVPRVRKAALVAKVNDENAPEKQQAVVERKKNRKTKRRNKPPKSTDEPVDPERWIPKYERSTYKGKRKLKHRGAQGATGASVTEAMKEQSKEAAKPVQKATPQPQQPAQGGANKVGGRRQKGKAKRK